MRLRLVVTVSSRAGLVSAPESLSQWAIFGWGSLGGFTAALLTLTLPWLYGIVKDDDDGPKFRTAIAACGLLALHSFFGGIAAIVGEADVAHQAIAFGLLWPTAFKGLGEAFKEIVAKSGY